MAKHKITEIEERDHHTKTLVTHTGKFVVPVATEAKIGDVVHVDDTTAEFAIHAPVAVDEDALETAPEPEETPESTETTPPATKAPADHL